MMNSFHTDDELYSFLINYDFLIFSFIFAT